MPVEQNDINKTTYSDDLKSLTKSTIISIIVIAGCFTTLIIIYTCHFGDLGWGDTGAFGTFGDYIGGLLNPLVAFLALIALLKATAIQTRFVKEQIDKDDRNQQEQIKREEEKQQRDLFSRNYDAYLKSIEAIVVEDRTLPLCFGKSALFIIYDKQVDFQLMKKCINEDQLETLDESHENRFFFPVFRMTFQILTSQTKKEYQLTSNEYNQITYENIKFFRAQLTEEELIFISLNILRYNDAQVGLTPFVRHFGLLKHLQAQSLRRAVEEKYGIECFGRNYVSKLTDHF